MVRVKVAVEVPSNCEEAMGGVHGHAEATYSLPQEASGPMTAQWPHLTFRDLYACCGVAAARNATKSPSLPDSALLESPLQGVLESLWGMCHHPTHPSFADRKPGRARF